MSEDIVLTLREDYGDGWLEAEPHRVINDYKVQRHKAATEIERLRARVEYLEREMRFIGRLDYPPTRLSARDRARAALEAKS